MGYTRSDKTDSVSSSGLFGSSNLSLVRINAFSATVDSCFCEDGTDKVGDQRQNVYYETLCHSFLRLTTSLFVLH